MRAFDFHQEAEAELSAAVDYYESFQEGLGLDFALEVHAAVQRIVEHPKPEATASVRGGYAARGTPRGTFLQTPRPPWFINAGVGAVEVPMRSTGC